MAARHKVVFMSLIQCSGCAATVDAAKAFCPDCGSPMEEELKDNSSTEFDSMMRTQNINKTAQLRMLDEFNLSGIFNLSKETEESNRVESQPLIPAPPVARQEPLFDPNKTQTIILKPQNDFPAATKKPEVTANSNKKLFVALGAGLLFFILAFVVLIIIGLLYWFYLR